MGSEELPGDGGNMIMIIINTLLPEDGQGGHYPGVVKLEADCAQPLSEGEHLSLGDLKTNQKSV